MDHIEILLCYFIGILIISVSIGTLNIAPYGFVSLGLGLIGAPLYCKLFKN